MSTLSALLPPWLGWAMVGLFAIIALSHLRHLLRTAGQRRPWHACHVLLAGGMLCMYAPGLSASQPVADAWQVLLGATGVIATLWLLSGTGKSLNPLWLLTILDLAVMIWMWSAHRPDTAVAWPAVVYLTAASLLWLGDLARQLDQRRPGLAHLLPHDSPDGQVVFRVWLTASTDAGLSLLGDLDISSSMSLMAAGMGYMVVVMHLA